MKKIQKLTKEESQLLIGGTFFGLISYDPQPTGGDTVNHNVIQSCACDYKNRSVIYNINEVAYCKCNCN